MRFLRGGLSLRANADASACSRSFSDHKLAQFFGVVNHRAVMRMFGFPLAQVFKKAVNIIARLGGQLIFDSPDFFENRIRFHGFILPQVRWKCKPPVKPVRSLAMNSRSFPSKCGFARCRQFHVSRMFTRCCAATTA